jgi:hypothetical protein
VGQRVKFSFDLITIVILCIAVFKIDDPPLEMVGRLGS